LNLDYRSIDLMSTPSDLASRVASEHDVTADRLARLEQELMTPRLSPSRSPPRFYDEDDNSMAHQYDDGLVVEEEEEEEKEIVHVHRSYDDDDDDLDDDLDDDDLDDDDLNNLDNDDDLDDNRVTTPVNHQATKRSTTPRYSSATTASISRTQTSASKSVSILRRQQARSEKQRIELVVRKGQVDSELERTVRENSLFLFFERRVLNFLFQDSQRFWSFFSYLLYFSF